VRSISCGCTGGIVLSFVCTTVGLAVFDDCFMVGWFLESVGCFCLKALGFNSCDALGLEDVSYSADALKDVVLTVYEECGNAPEMHVSFECGLALGVEHAEAE
jgi:hypothetical protein